MPILRRSNIIKNKGDANSANRTLSNKIADLNLYAAEKGIKIHKGLGGPCLAKMQHSYAIDEDLNLYSCPGYVYSESHGHISSDNKKTITNSTWYDNVINDPKCIDECKYAPICYGGCSWSKGEQETSCQKNVYDISIIPRLQAYVLSKYL